MSPHAKVPVLRSLTDNCRLDRPRGTPSAISQVFEFALSLKTAMCEKRFSIFLANDVTLVFCIRESG